ncbi:MAG TPA: hypothetical protein VD903_13525 [Pseudonocardia sp.]|nr:hypothetical protein [Pseudonocardia sp.]
MTTASEGCGAHAGVGEELRSLALTALDRIDPVIDRMRDGTAADDGGTGTCAACPVCAVLAALRGERPELAARMAEHAAGLVAVLRAALEEGAPAPAPDAAPEPPPARRVQRIRVERPAG